jgi:GAF domain-containing protein
MPTEQSGSSQADRRAGARRRDDQHLITRLKALETEVSVLEVIRDLTTTLNQADSVEVFCEAALTALYQALKAHRSSILLFDPTGCMRFKAWRGLSDGYRTAVEGHSPWSPNEGNAKPIVIADVSEEPLGALQSTILEEGIRSLGFFPLVSKGKLLGKFMVYFEGPHHFTNAEIDLASTIAHHIAFALERKQHEEELHAAFQELRKAKAELEEKVRELEGFEEVAIGRELKMIALEREVAQLKARMT